MVPFAAALKRTATAFRSDERGTMAMLFAAAVTTLGLAVGSSVDYGEASKVQARMNGAADAASLAGAKLIAYGVKDQARIIDEVTRNFEANFAAETARGIKHAPLDIAMDAKTGAVRVKVSAKVPTAFMKIAAIDSLTIGSTSTSQIDSDTIEVAMMLDTTRSMLETTTDGKIKVLALREAASDLVDTMFRSVPAGSDRVKIGLAPFASTVNAGVYGRSVSAWQSSACVMERWNAAENTSDESARAYPLRPVWGCPSTPIMPLTTDKTALKARIASLGADGSTAGHLGTTWASYLLSPKWGDVFPAANTGRDYGTVGNKKIAILMTDGKFNTFYGENKGDTGPNAIKSAAAAIAACDEMKAKGITVYTIGFAMTGSLQSATDTLKTCASTIDGVPAFYDAKDAAALSAAYDDIANRILTIRISS